MRRVMSLWLPNWAIDRWRRQGSRKHRPFDDTPFVLSATIGNRRLVTAADAEAQAMGIAPGMPLTDARALHPALAVAESDPARDRAALARLAAWCGRYSPWTAPHGGDGIWLDITGCAHLRGGESALAAELIERLARQGIAGRVAIADTPGAAWAMARGSGAATAVVPEGGARQALAALPVDALRLDPVVIAELGRLGLRRIGDLYAMPRAALAARFGERLAHRLDQALGLAAEPLSPLPPASSRWARLRFAEPIGTAEDIAAATRELLARLCGSLADEMLGARRLVLTLYRVDGASETASIGTARPSRDPGHLLRLFEERLTTLDPGLGVEDMLLAAATVEKLAATQLGFRHRLSVVSRSPSPPFRGSNPFDRFAIEPEGAARRSAAGLLGRDEVGSRRRARFASSNPPPPPTSPPPGAERSTKSWRRNLDTLDDTSLAMLVDRLANHLGSAALGCLVPQESHLPERSSRFAPVFAPAAVTAWEKPWQRPIRLLPRPEPIEAVAPVPDDPPVRFRWRRVMHRVRRADGPERIAEEWWRGGADAAELRDYYCVEDETGRRFWLYRVGLYQPETAPRWFLHGLFA